jgi:hypothetical protein
VAIYRLFFHPLNEFPGPRLARITTLYKTYYEVVKGGELLQKIRELHAVYGESDLTLFKFYAASPNLLVEGPVIRIGPNEVGSTPTNEPTCVDDWNSFTSVITRPTMRFIRLNLDSPKIQLSTAALMPVIRLSAP